MNWRQEVVAQLANDPLAWVSISELFASVETSIPIHRAMRHATQMDEQKDVSLHTARWRYFLEGIYRLTDRKASDGGPRSYRPKLGDLVRLRPNPDRCCQVCGSPMYLSYLGTQRWKDPSRYACVACVAPPTPAPTPATLDDELVIDRAYLRGPLLVPLTPRALDPKVVRILLPSTLEDAWREFGKQPAERVTLLAESAKAREVGRGAFRDGANDMMIRVGCSDGLEFALLGGGEHIQMMRVLYNRAGIYVSQRRLKRWLGGLAADGFIMGSVTMFWLLRAGRHRGAADELQKFTVRRHR